ncbi:hypothetical protein, partial [Acinetobacter baumannii]|uniref:hypothetical protein n=1 Tax=Acinetobacter baumannii TaxID=470 RepID=UPI0013D28F2B
FTLAPGLQTVGLSATVADPGDLARFLVPQHQGRPPADIVVAEGGAQAEVSMLETRAHLPWSGHSAKHAIHE